MISYEQLTPITPSKDCSYLHSGEMPILVRPEDPALSVMIDFLTIKPAIIAADKPIETANNTMKVRDLPVLLALDDDRVVGLISSQDIVGEKPIQLMQERRITRNEILVNMLMTPTEKALFFKLEHLKKAKVGHVFTTLIKQHQPHAGVIDEQDGKQSVCGLYSTYQIRKRLHIEAHILDEAHSLAELQQRHT